MPGISSESGESSSLVPFSPEVGDPVVYPLHHGLKPPISRLSISWSRGNSLRVSVFLKPQSDADDSEIGGKVVEVKLGSGDGEIDDAQWRRIAYGSVSPFALLQSRKNSMSALSKMSASSSAYEADWWEYVMEYSSDINFLLGGQKLPPSSVIEDPKTILKKVEEPTCLKSAWELLEIFYADKHSQAWMPERLLDWLADYDSLLSGTQPTVHSKLVNFQKDLVSLQAIEDDPKYWEAMSSPLAVGWLDIAVKMLHLHGSYQLDQLGNREIENGLVEAVAVLISKMPRLRPELAPGKLGECYKTKPDFIKAWEKWRAQLTKLDCSTYWVQCDHNRTKEGLKNLLQIMLGNANILSSATCNWIELHISHLLYIRPFTMVSCVSRVFKIIWSLIAPIYLTSCMKQGMGLLEILLYKQPVQHNQLLLKVVTFIVLNIEICRLYELDSVSSKIMKIAGVHHWKHGKKGSGVFWLQQAQDEVCLNRIAQQLFNFVGKSISDESLKQWEGLIELLGSESRTAGGLEFLHKYFILNSNLGCSTGIGISKDPFSRFMMELLLMPLRKPVESLISLMKNPSTPQRFWLPLLYDSVISSLVIFLIGSWLKLLNWQDRPLLNVSQTNLLLNKLQELSMARLRPDFIEADLPSQALSSVRLALATNLGRAILEE
ncbi:hypothetical protein HYC85_023115 [Camellia sinensis]|uniref:Nuclear pore complex protein Nup85 n=1 Tax=Camellia sinensis TaxID=4442 RepID=A0A7J7GHJ9_CAMSI|nr:hypothetical protein HYC85_023115 [Camellia sinensis]